MQEGMESGSELGLSIPQPGPSGLEGTRVQSPQSGADDVASQSSTLDISRRKAFKPFIREKFKTLCMELEDYPVEGLGDKIKAMGDANRITKSLSMDPEHRRKTAFLFLGQSHPGKHSGGMAYSRQGQNWRNPYQGRPA
ncbi:hypothetical protein PoB_001810800 [Plakobranchus ocellatus]|uniref:Uncharacterized protein n=1 Tax=Plakobranchus ocellatus TaxID=259542 RepID=A0AAV3ZAH6_9GAST|nr:hypothetical protein PoB_001810800 [Plakobranchus ocellatus]